MRLGVVVDAGAEWAVQRDLARRAEDLGFDLLWLDDGGAVDAGALAGVTETIRVGLQVATGANPLILAEEAAVADLVLGGRLVLALAGDHLAETVEVVLSGLAPRPFAHDGPKWKIPANFPSNVATESRVLVTPFAAQVELPLWVGGPGAPEVAAEYGLSYLGQGHESSDDLRAVWSEIDSALGPAATRLRRPAIRRLDEGDDPARTVEALEADRRAWGLDVAVLDAPIADVATIPDEMRS
jgi:alkanesulfonate monooxygenase SsuD/methylene tetrahydromethanopterin reductase-like flavin-dependent oxidoreductase (luciferase family)